MAKVKKIQVFKIPVNVEYNRPVLGRLYWYFMKIRLIKFVKFNVTLLGEPIFSFYGVCVPFASKD